MATTPSGLRLRVLEPAVGATVGGTRVVIHGTGFRPLPHSLLVRFRLAETTTRIEVPAKFLLETQIECVIPNFRDDARLVLARRTTLAPTSATIDHAPHLIPLHVEVILDSERMSNALVFLLHQEITIAKITPQCVLLTPPTSVTATINLLKLSTATRLFARHDKTIAPELAEINSLPVYARVRQVSERTGAVSERTVEGRWRISSVGVYEVEFDAVMITFGEATVELTLNRHDYFRAKDKTPDARGYCVHRDVTLVSLDPCCLSVTSGRSTEVRLLGEGFVDSGDLTVRLLQRDIQEAASNTQSARDAGKVHPVAQLTGTFLNTSEIRCSVPPNMSFGLTHFQVSLNGGRQYGKDHTIALLHRDRAIEGVAPLFASLDGNTAIQIRLAQLTVDNVDAPYQIQSLIPPRRIRVKFEAIGDDEDSSVMTIPLVKVVNADVAVASTPERNVGSSEGSTSCNIISCRVPSFLENVKLLKELHSKSEVQPPVEFALVRRFRISLSLGGDSFFGSVPFGYYFPPVIQSMTKHHGPRSGGTITILRMKHRVPRQLAIQVRFLHIATRKFEIVRGFVGSDYFAEPSSSVILSVGSPVCVGQEQFENPESLIVCTSPSWSSPDNEPVLTKVQVSFDGGFNFVPGEEEQELIAAGLMSPRSKSIPPQLVKDMSYLYFLFYPVPRLCSVLPMSADIQGGSFIRIGGDHIVDHGGRISVVFQSPELSRKVSGFIENGELRCCVPPFNVGPVTIFVSLNGEQFTKCEFVDPDSRRPIDFVFYSSPVLQRLSPLCASISHSSLIRIFGVNLIETGRVKVRFGFTNHSGKLVFKDVPGRAENGVIMARSPLFSADYGNLKAVVDVALNGNDYSGKILSLYYYSSYSIRRIEPPVGAIDIPIPMTVHVSQNIISDVLLVRLRFKKRYVPEELMFGPVPVTCWESNRIDFILPPLCEYAASLADFEGAFVDISFDREYLHETGDLLKYYRPYKLPPVLSITPLVGQFEQETEVIAKCTDVQEGDIVTMTMTLEFLKRGSPVIVSVEAESNSKRQTLMWRCPSLSKLLNLDLKKVLGDDKRMILPASLGIQISTIKGQLLTLPFHFQYYRMPILLSMSPQVGYICGGSLISFEFKEPIETPTIDFRFGPDIITSGRVREDNKRLVECLSPVIAAGMHVLSMSFNEQYFEEIYIVTKEEPTVSNKVVTVAEGITSSVFGVPEEEFATLHNSGRSATRRTKCTFQAFAMPHFTIPDNVHRVYGYGPLDGGSLVVIKGRGFIADGKIYVRFCSSFGDTLIGPSGSQSELVVKARVLDDMTIVCTSPPCTRSGRVLLQVTYNLQQYTDSLCFFEYHERTTFTSRGILCGPVSGGTPVCIQIEDRTGLPEDTTLLQSSCAVRFTNANTGQSLATEAHFDDETLQIQCLAPSWPSNELVAIEVAFSKDAGAVVSSRQFFPTSVRFLFYDPPEGLITLEPSAGPITGGTEVLALCGKLVDTGEIMVSVTIVDEHEQNMTKLTSVGEDEENEDDADDEEPSQSSKTSSVTSVNNEVYLVKGKIVGEAVSFVTPAVCKPGIAHLHIALNGINYTSTQTAILRYKYYCDPVICRISPTWSSLDTECTITINGIGIEDHGCKPVIQFQQQLQHQGKEPQSNRFLVDGQFVDAPTESKTTTVTSRALQCSFQAPQAGFYEIQISLNGGQQFTACKFMPAMYGNYNGSVCTGLLPFRAFSSPFLLATPTGSVAGGSSVTLFMNKKLSKLLQRETKCQVQFTPIRNSDTVGGSMPSTSSPHKTGGADGVVVVGEIDHQDAKIMCRAPLLRIVCVAALDLLLPGSLTTDSTSASLVTKATTGSISTLTSCSAYFGVKEREKFHAYESPTITELTPSCGPLSGRTCMVIECSNIVDTGQIFVRFRSSANERECVLVPAIFTRTFPDGSLSVSPLLICRTPQVEIIDRIVVSVNESSSNSTYLSPGRGSNTREGSTNAMTAKARAHTFQQMAEASLRRDHGKIVLRVTRAVLKNALSSTISGAISVLVDFTMNAGEQFIAHSVPFQFYPVIDPREIRWFPRHVPTQCFDRSTPMETRVVTIQLPKALRTFTDSATAAERVSVYYEGAPQQIFSPAQKRRGSSIVLRETGNGRELVVLNAPPGKLRKESSIRRKSSYFRNSSISATSNNLLDSSGASLVASATRPRGGVPRDASSRRLSGASGLTSTSGSAGTSWSTPSGSVPSSGSSSQTSPPYIAARIVKAGLDITCPIPEFSGCGTVKVYFSFNAQQFVCLGELYVHEPLSIRENRQHRFTSNIGGDCFNLFCSVSSVFDFCSPAYVLNEVEVLAKQPRDTGVVKASKALCSKAESVDSCSVGDLRPPSIDLSSTLQQVGEWRDRLFHVVHVHLVPPNHRLLRELVISARSLSTRTELASSSPDGFGCCVFEITEWASTMLLVAKPPANSSISSFSCVFSRPSSIPQSATASSTPSPCRSHAMLIQLPITQVEISAACYFCTPGLENRLLIINEDGSPTSGATTTFEDEQCSLISLNTSSQDSSSGYYVCLDARGPVNEQCEVHVAVANAIDVQVYLRGTIVEGGVWVVAFVARQPSGSVTVVEIDHLVDNLEDLVTKEALANLRQIAQEAATQATNCSTTVQLANAKPMTVTTQVKFAYADSSRNLSEVGAAQLILPGEHTLSSFINSADNSTKREIELRCEMPALSFSGPTIVSVQVDGVTFSNSICVHCYDPRLWRITRIDPPCGLVHQPLKMRVIGENFVDNKKTAVRFSDSTRYLDYAATMERYRLLIVRVAAVRNLRNLLPPQFGTTPVTVGASPQKTQQLQSQQNRDELSGSTPFTIVARVVYRDQVFQANSRDGAVQAALSTSATSPLGWDDQFEVQIPCDAVSSAYLVVSLELIEASANRTTWELGRAIVPVDSLQETVLTKQTYPLEEQFRWRNRGTPSSSTCDADVLLHLSPLMTHQDVFVCEVAPFAVPQRLRVQVSSGDSFLSPCPPLDQVDVDDLTISSGIVSTMKAYRSFFHIYELPIVSDSVPRVLPRTAGGEVMISGEGFIDSGASRCIWVRLFACRDSSPLTDASEIALLEQINTTLSLQTISTSMSMPFFVRDVQATFVSSSALKVVIPPRIATYSIYYRVSIDDGVHFSLATPRSRVMMYSADALDPKGGPVSGNTYVAVRGSNINMCMALGGLSPVVKLTWMRGTKELEHVIVRGEFYPPEDVVYFYTPQSKFGLQNITVHVELSLVNTTELPSVGSNAYPPTSVVLPSGAVVFGQDELPFVIYRTPTIKSIAPLQSLVCGLSSLELIVQGLDEKAASLLRGSIKARFKRRGQMQIADVNFSSATGVNNDGKLVTIVPRFIVGSAVATDVAAASICPPSPTRQSQTTNRNQAGPFKVWTRQGTVVVVLLRARNLFVAKKTSSCNPFVVIHCNKAQLKSTRKDGTSSPIWNEVFDYDWRNETELPHLIRLSIENQLASNQSELIGQVSIRLSDVRDLGHPFCTRMWLPLRRVSTRGAPNMDSNGKRADLGDVEVAIAYIPLPPKKVLPKFLQAAALKTSIMSAMQQQRKAVATTVALPQQETPRARKERLLRAFRRQGAPASLVPSELVVELAVNGQDFWSIAPSRCLAVPTPIVLSVEPAFLCMSGGTPLTISGVNFVQSGLLRVAFALVGVNGNESPNRTWISSAALESKRITVVDARYRSSQCITCVTPPLRFIGATESSLINLYISINGLDFDSIALPLQGIELPVDEETVCVNEVVRTPPSTKSAIQLVGEMYVINSTSLSTHEITAPRAQMPVLVHQVRVYLRPIIHSVRPADGVYTSLLVIEGHDFTNTGIAIARYCSKIDTQDIRTGRVNVISSERMECAMPDFPRGTVVTMSIAVNGIEFVSCPGELEVFQLPRLTEIVPNWVFVAADGRQDVRIRGINLTTKGSVSGSVQVSFRRGDRRRVVKGQCVDGEVLCSVPSEVILSPQHEKETRDQAEMLPSILVDVWLGGTHKTFTERPLELHLYGSIPIVSQVAPTNGPIYGGYSVTIEGSGFINTGRIVVRFLLLQDAIQQLETSGDPSSSPLAAGKTLGRQFSSSQSNFVDVSARFVSPDALVCVAPSFPQEGVYSIAIALNGVEFNVDAAIKLSSTWFLAWQNWQRRKQLTAHRVSMEISLNIKVDEPAPACAVDSNIPIPSTPTSLQPSRPLPSPRPSTVETAFGRRTTSRSSLRSEGDGFSLGELESPKRRRDQLRQSLDKLVEDENLERAEDHFVDMRLLQWHPATVDDRNRSLAQLLADLFNAPETQQIMIRRIGFVFRVRGSRDTSTGQYIVGSLSSFTQAMKLIFPNTPESHIEDVWKLLDPAQLGYVSLRNFTKHFVVNDALRPRSPEPGPTHYTPHYSLVETKPPATIILPESIPSSENAGLPSELFMNYDAFKAVRPRVKGGAFLKRELGASWCNPVPKEKIFQVETDDDVERSFIEAQQQKTDNPLGTLASSPRRTNPRPPVLDAKSMFKRKALFTNRKKSMDDTSEGDRSEDEATNASGVSRGERLARAAAAANHDNSTSKLASARGATPTSVADSGARFSSTRTRSILHDDIAPLYLKFLRSKEVQKANSTSNE